MIINNKFLVMIGLKPTTPWSKFHYRIILGSSFQQQSVQKSSFSSSSSGAAASTQVKSILKQPASVKHGEEIQQESLKTTIQSAITDIEQGMYRTTLTDGTGVTESGWNNRLVSLIMYVAFLLPSVSKGGAVLLPWYDEALKLFSKCGFNLRT